MFRFTIRDVLWLMVVVAVCTAWWTDRRQIAGLQQQSRELVSIKHALRDVGLERLVGLMVMFNDPSKEAAIKYAGTVAQPTANPADWSKEETERFLDLVNSKPTP